MLIHYNYLHLSLKSNCNSMGPSFSKQTSPQDQSRVQKITLLSLSPTSWPAGEFWGLKSTNLNLAKIGHPCPTYWNSYCSQIRMVDCREGILHSGRTMWLHCNLVQFILDNIEGKHWNQQKTKWFRWQSLSSHNYKFFP